MTAQSLGFTWEEVPVAVIGAGYMGTGIAHVLAVAGASVTLVDVGADRAELAREGMLRRAERLEADSLVAGGSAAAIRDRVRSAATVAGAVAAAGLIVEAVPEDRAVKRAVLSEVAPAMPSHAVLTSNTSSIPIAELARAVPDPSRLLGVHWFNPAEFVPGVEVIPTVHTDPSIIDPLVALLRGAGKVPVVVADAPGFVANRLQFALFREAALMVEDGVADATQIDEVVRCTFGFRMPWFGPFAVADGAGLDVYLGAYRTLHDALGDRFAPPDSLVDLVGRGQLGAKAGGGFLGPLETTAEELRAERDRAFAAGLRQREDVSG